MRLRRGWIPAFAGMTGARPSLPHALPPSLPLRGISPSGGDRRRAVARKPSPRPSPDFGGGGRTCACGGDGFPPARATGARPLCPSPFRPLCPSGASPPRGETGGALARANPHSSPPPKSGEGAGHAPAARLDSRLRGRRVRSALSALRASPPRGETGGALARKPSPQPSPVFGGGGRTPSPHEARLEGRAQRGERSGGVRLRANNCTPALPQSSSAEGGRPLFADPLVRR